MDNKIQQLYGLLLKEEWRVDKVIRETRHNLVIIHIYLEATMTAVVNDFLGRQTHRHITFTAYRL